MLETFIPAAIGATVSIVDSCKERKLKMLRMWTTGYFTAIYTAQDVVNVVKHFSTIELNKGSAAFLLALMSAAVIEKIIFAIQSYNVERWYK